MGRKQTLFEHQAHALVHALGACDGSVARHSSAPQAVCPLCLEPFSIDHMEEEHAPQRGGQSRLGERWSLVMTCGSCNHSAGESFESESALTRNELSGSAGHFCSVHPGFGRTSTGLWVVQHQDSVESTDLKSAYLLASLVLGHRWFLSQRLDPVRSAIKAGRGTGGAVLVAVGIDASLERTVVEVTSPVTCVMVVGGATKEGHFAVIFPSENGAVPSALFGAAPRSPVGTTLWMPTSPGHGTSEPVNVSVKPWPWPRLIDATYKQVDQADRAGSLFHFDKCEGVHPVALTSLQIREMSRIS